MGLIPSERSMNAAPPKTKRNDKYQRILQAAAKVFARRGFYQSTVADVARSAGVAGGTIYLYFANKDDILVKLFDQKMREVFAGFRRAVDGAEGGVAKLRQLVRYHLSAFAQDRNMAIIYQAETRRNNRVVEVQVREMAKMYADLVAEIIEVGQQEGIFRKNLYVGLVKQVMVGAMDEVIFTWLNAGCQYDLMTMADPLVALFISGIETRGAGSR